MSGVVTYLSTTGANAEAIAAARRHLACDLAAQTARWLPAELSIFDGQTGAPLHCAQHAWAADWDLVAQLGLAACHRGEPSLLSEEEYWAVVCIPLTFRGIGTMFAAGAVLTRPVTAVEITDLEELAGVAPSSAQDWAVRQRPCPVETLLKTAGLWQQHVKTEARLTQLQGETATLAEQLSSTYEEISLLHRLTQNLTITSGQTNLGRMALEWLDEVAAAEGVALLLTNVKGKEPGQEGETARSVLLTHGRCPIDAEQFEKLVQGLGLTKNSGPFVANSYGGRDDWPAPQVRDAVIVPVCEGENHFGWLAALNRTGEIEFGSHAASLLASVASILGIHNGNVELYRQQAELLAGVIQALTSAIDAKDPYTSGHSDRVARVSVRLAQELGAEPDAVRTIYLGGLLHDIGKIGVDDAVLRKPGRLTPDEYEHIKSHVEVGYNILGDLKKLEPMLPIVRHHHEAWDGSGYPDKLRGEEIPLLARIVAVADAFDAMGSDRPYRHGMGDEKLDSILRDGAGVQWDRQVVDAFFRARDDIRQIARQRANPCKIETEVPDWPHTKTQPQR